MDSLSHLISGFGVALRPFNILLAVGGVGLGTFVGMLPGIGPINAIAILIPVTFASGMPAESGTGAAVFPGCAGARLISPQSL